MSQQMLYDWFSGQVLTNLAQSEQVAPGLPKPLPAALYKFGPTSPVGVNVIYEAIIGNRQTAKFTDYLSPAANLETLPRQRNQAVALGARIATPIDGELMIGLMNNVPIWQQRAKEILNQKFRDFRNYSENLQLSMVHSAIFTDSINADSNGNLLPSSSGAVNGGFKFNSLYAGANALQYNSHWPGVPATAQNLVGDFSNASTDIPSSFRAMDQGYTFTSNYKPKNIIYGKDLPRYFYNNTNMLTYMSRQPQINSELLLSNEVPQGLFRYNWFPAADAYYVDQNGVTQQWCADNQMVIMPDVNLNWWENFECSLPCPKGMVTPAADLQQFLDACPPVRGYSSYVLPCWNPVKADLIAQAYSLPVLKSPYANFSVFVSPTP